MIPNGPKGSPAEGKPCLSMAQLSTFGAADVAMTNSEDLGGCPRRYKAKYVDGIKEIRSKSMPLAYGSMIHRVLELVENQSISVDEALTLAWDPQLPPEQFAEAVADLDRWMSRPSDGSATLATEIELYGLLYVDEEFGEVWYRGFIDRLDIDAVSDRLLYVVDYKTNRSPVSQSDVDASTQGKGYCWLVDQNYERWLPVRPQIVFQLDPVKFGRVLTAGFSDATLQEWEAWVEAVARKILRDKKADPVLSSGCSWCHVKADCPKYQKLPGEGVSLLEKSHDLSRGRRWEWRVKANAVRLLLEKEVKTIDLEMLEAAYVEGELEVGDQRWSMQAAWRNEIDMHMLWEALGDELLSLVKISKKAVEERASAEPSLDKASQIRGSLSRVEIGTSMSRRQM